MEPEPVAKAGQQPAAKEHESGDKKGKGGGDKKGKGGDQNAPRKEKEEEKPPKVYYLQSLLTGPIAARICDALKTAEPPLTLAPADVEGYLQPPSRRNAGDLCLVTYPFARRLKQQPQPLAKFLVDKLQGTVPSCTFACDGAYVNVTIDAPHVAKTLLPVLVQAPVKHTFSSDAGQGKVVCIDFSSPNIAKHLALHHIRSTMIGNSLMRMYAAAGYKTVGINFLGDWGTAFGRLIAGWKREKLTLAALESAPEKVTFMNDLYVRISNEAKKDASVKEEARFWSKKLEDGDAEALQLWTIFRDVSLREFDKVYRLLDVKFDAWKGESAYRDSMGPVVAELREKGLLRVDSGIGKRKEEEQQKKRAAEGGATANDKEPAKAKVKNEGALVVDVPGLDKPVLVVRADGASLYTTRDLAAADDRWREYGFDRALYVVDAGQSLHFQEWFGIAKILGRPFADRLRHVRFGVMLRHNSENGQWERIATRKGVPMLLLDVLHEAIQKAHEILLQNIEDKKSKNPDLASITPAEAEELARAVGVAALVFNDLKSNRVNDVKFKLEDALSMEGHTGPYVQFTHARLCSIERKFAEKFPKPPPLTPDLYALLGKDEEKQILLQLTRLTAVLERGLDLDEPSTICQALLTLSGAISSWLTAGNTDLAARIIVESDPALSLARLQIVRVLRANIARGLQLLGLAAPTRM